MNVRDLNVFNDSKDFRNKTSEALSAIQVTSTYQN